MSARRVRTPTILQTDALQCGAVSLGIVLAHHGRWVPVEELARACGVSRNGARAGDLVRAARRYGLRAQGFRAEPAALRGMPLPLLLHWDFNHFLVLEGFARNGRVHVNDPATGPRTVGADELDRSMTGVVIALEPDAGFRPAGEAPRPLRSLRRRAAGVAGGMAPVLLGGLALTAAGLAAPLLARAFVDGVLLEGRRGWLLPILLGLAGLAGASALLTWRQANDLLRLERRLALDAPGRFLDHLLRLPVVFFDRNYTGALSERVALNDRVARFLCRDLAVNAVAGVLAVFFLALMLRYSPALAAVAVAVVSGNLLALRWVARRRADATQRLLQEEMKLNGTALLGLRTIETVKATASENDLFARWSGYQARLVNARQRLTRATHLLEALPPFLAALSTALVVGIGALEVMDGRMTLGGLLAFQLLVAGFLAPANRLVGLAGRLETAEGDVRRLDEVLEHAPELPPLEAEAAADAEPDAIRGHLELEDVVFGFAALDPPLLEGVGLRLEPGRRVALVGKTGSGKSTLARLAAGIYAPWSGRVLLDGRPREEHPRAAIVRAVAVVDQEIALFGGTVRDNLTLWDEAVPTERMEAAARDACIHDEIEARGGYGAAVEERGANWSGGQRQRLEIARALAGDPAVLVLDEATSALDPETEARIDQALRRRGCACLVVAHRLSTVRSADEIVVLEEGRVVERGTHNALYARSGAYRRLLEAE